MFIVFPSFFFYPHFDAVQYTVSRQDTKGGKRKEFFRMMFVFIFFLLVNHSFPLSSLQLYS